MSKLFVYLGCFWVENEKDKSLPKICKHCENEGMGIVAVPDELVPKLLEMLSEGEWGVGKFMDEHKGEFQVTPCARGGERYLTSTVGKL